MSGFKITGNSQPTSRTCFSKFSWRHSDALSLTRKLGTTNSWGSEARIAYFDSPTTPPWGMAGFAAVKAVRLRYRTDWNTIQGTRGRRNNQFGQNSWCRNRGNRLRRSRIQWDMASPKSAEGLRD